MSMATKRLLHELKAHATEASSDAIAHLGPESQDNLHHWTAVLKGVPGTAYEGMKVSAVQIHAAHVLKNVP